MLLHRGSWGQLRGIRRGVSLLLEVLYLLMLYRARVGDREKVGQVMLVPVATSVHYLSSLA
jgi:hypothetical protein